jgi:hypothetical protein
MASLHHRTILYCSNLSRRSELQIERPKACTKSWSRLSRYPSTHLVYVSSLIVVFRQREGIPPKLGERATQSTNMSLTGSFRTTEQNVSSKAKNKRSAGTRWIVPLGNLQHNLLAAYQSQIFGVYSQTSVGDYLTPRARG